MLLVILLQFAGLAVSPVAKGYLSPANDDGDLIGKYVNATQIQATARKDLAVEVTIEARLPKLHRQATLRALRIVGQTGAVTYQTLDTAGDDMVRREVIARYLAAESESHQTEEMAITPAHYRFRLAATVERTGQRIMIFQLAPRKKQVGLFKGELWVDGQTGLPVHVAGQFVRSPSIFIRKIVFTRDYEIFDGVNLPTRLHSTVDSRIAGRAELDIRIAVRQ